MNTEPEREPEWWSVAPESAYSASTDPDAMADAAAHMRDAAEALRDAAAPAPPTKESHWDWSWLTDWLRYGVNGVALKRAAYSSGPAMAVLLWTYEKQTGNSPASAAIFFAMVVGIGHLKFRRPVTRWLLWGAVLAPIYYVPALLSIIFGIGVVLTQGV